MDLSTEITPILTELYTQLNVTVLAGFMSLAVVQIILFCSKVIEYDIREDDLVIIRFTWLVFTITFTGVIWMEIPRHK